MKTEIKELYELSMPNAEDRFKVETAIIDAIFLDIERLISCGRRLENDIDVDIEMSYDDTIVAAVTYSAQDSSTYERGDYSTPDFYTMRVSGNYSATLYDCDGIEMCEIDDVFKLESGGW